MKFDCHYSKRESGSDGCGSALDVRPMKLFLFGQIGSGKSHVGHLLGERFNLHFHDADDDLPTSIRIAVKNHLPISDTMRDEFTEIIVSRIRSLSTRHENLCVAQALFKNKHREKLLCALPDIRMVWVRSHPDLIARRLERRTDHLATAYYATVVNPKFEVPTIPHESVENTEDGCLLDHRLAELITRIRSNQALEPMASAPSAQALLQFHACGHSRRGSALDR